MVKLMIMMIMMIMMMMIMMTMTEEVSWEVDLPTKNYDTLPPN